MFLNVDFFRPRCALFLYTDFSRLLVTPFSPPSHKHQVMSKVAILASVDDYLGAGMIKTTDLGEHKCGMIVNTCVPVILESLKRKSTGLPAHHFMTPAYQHMHRHIQHSRAPRH